jgi:hypothetical protein
MLHIPERRDVEMNKIFSAIRRLLADLGRGTQADPLAAMSVREFADLPPYHPQSDH